MKKRLFLALLAVSMVICLTACNIGDLLVQLASIAESKDQAQTSDQSAAPQPSETEKPQPTESAAPQPTESAAPQPTESAAPQPTESAAPQPTESAAPQPTESAAPQPSTDPVTRPSTSPQPSRPTQSSVPEPTRPTSTTAPAEQYPEGNPEVLPINLLGHNRSFISTTSYRKEGYLRVYTMELDPSAENKYPELYERMAEDWAYTKSLALSDYLEIGDMIDAARKDPMLSKEDGFYVDTDAALRRADSRVLSYYLWTWENIDGTYETETFRCVNYDSQTGDTLLIEDIVTDTNKLSSLIEADLIKNYGSGMKGTATPIRYLIDTGDLDFTLEYDRLTFYFEESTISFSADGRMISSLAFRDLPAGLVRAKYLEVPDAYATTIPIYLETPISVGNKTRHLLVEPKKNADDFYYQLVIHLDGKNYIEDVYAFDYLVQMVHANNKDYLYIFSFETDDYTALTVYDLTGTTASPIKQVGGYGPMKIQRKGYDDMGQYNNRGDFFGYKLITDPTYFQLRTHCDLLSTYAAYSYFEVDKKGLPSILFHHDGNPLYAAIDAPTLTALQSFTGDAFDYDSGASKGKVTINKGTKLTIINTDCDHYVYFEYGNHQVVRVWVTHFEGETLVDDTPIEALFGGMMFAG